MMMAESGKGQETSGESLMTSREGSMMPEGERATPGAGGSMTSQENLVTSQTKIWIQHNYLILLRDNLALYFKGK